jgi:hypothetical protein
MPLIDFTYFKDEINLPEMTYGSEDGYGGYLTYIERYEKEILIKLFGYEIYKLIAAYDPASPGDTEQRIRDIIEGKEFTVSNYTYKWNGLVNTSKVSIIAYYVYYYIIRDQVSNSSTTGQVENQKENGVVVSPKFKMSNAWDKMQRLIGECFRGEYYADVNYFFDEEYYNSLYFFMSDNYNTYPEWRYGYIGSVNAFDL